MCRLKSNIMVTKYFFVFLLSLNSVLSQKSLTLVVDTTFSMRNEIDIIKVNIASVLNAIKRTEITQYILLTFGDQDVGPPLISSNTRDLLDIISLMEVDGGNDCHENSLAAIEKALTVSQPRSYIYVFTDAPANKHGQLDSIKKLCHQQKSQVVIFQSGRCEQDNVNEIDNAYYEITSSCGGSIFHVKINHFREVLKYIKEITKVDWTDVNTHEEFRNSKKFTFTIDTYTKDVIICISGKYPTLQIKNVFGDSIRVEKIIDTQTMLVVRLIYTYSDIGEYTTDIKCQGAAIATMYSKKELDFQYGFSPLEPITLKETVSKPIPGAVNFMLISLQQVSSTELVSVFLQTDKHESNKLEFLTLNRDKGLYMATIFIETESPFTIKIKCRDTSNNKEINGITPIIFPQKIETSSQWSSPIMNIIEPESALIDFATSFSMACKVKSSPAPDIWWENGKGEKLSSKSALLEMPSTYISYVTIENVTRNETLICKCKNSKGEDEVSFDLYVNRTFKFNVIQYPQETTIEYGKKAILYCEVDAYPEADIKWYHNDTLVEETENVHLIPDEHMLLINEMTLEYTGKYECKISNIVETRSFSADVFITGLEAPEIQLGKLEVTLKPGDFTEQQCTVIKGIPMPSVTWKYKSKDGDINNLPEGVVVDDTSLKIPSVNTNHGGFYVCEAVNILGNDNQEMTVKVQYPPKIKNTEDVKTVIVGETVELLCEVDAVPQASVHWNMVQDDVIVSLDDRHQVDDSNTHRFYASANDSGIYHCIAENEMGMTTRTVILNVLVPPYIKSLDWETLTVRRGLTLVLPCNVIWGTPVPATRWQYVSPRFETTVLMRGTGRLDLVVQNLTQKHEGVYQCVAENEVGIDSVKVNVKTT